MGKLVDGNWRDGDLDAIEAGRFRRAATTFRRFVSADSAAFPARTGRYHLYVSHACPWAHRTMIMRRLRGLERVVGVSSFAAEYGQFGWQFDADAQGGTVDHVAGRAWLKDVYLAADPAFTGRVTVPALWDRATNTIVNNESREIVRMFDHAFRHLGDDPDSDWAPPELVGEIEAMIDANYGPVNDGVYRTGFARTQDAYDEAVAALFTRLDVLEQHLSRKRFLVGDRFTEADVCLFPTLVRFDAVYHGHFKCNRRRVVDYPALWAYTREIYQMPGIAETVDLAHTRRHYYGSHRSLNPHGIVAVGPDLETALRVPPGRSR